MVVPPCYEYKITIKSVPPKPKQRKFSVINPLLDFSKSQISSIYALCLRNILEDHRDCSFDLQIPGRRYRTALAEGDDTDGNAFAWRATSKLAEHSPRGFRIDGWTLYKTKNPGTPNISSSKGTFEKRLVPHLVRGSSSLVLSRKIRKSKYSLNKSAIGGQQLKT